MRVLPVSDAAIAEALSALARGGCIVHATETCYGFAADLTDKSAVARLFAVKNRPPDQPVSALFASVAEAKRYVEWNAPAEELARKRLPGPLTIVLTRRSDAPYSLLTTPPQRKRTTSDGQPATIGVRVSPHPVAQELARRFGRPLSTTSANLHGQPEPYNAEEIVRQFSGRALQPDLILDSGMLPRTPPSTVMDCTGNAPRTLRG